MAPSKSERHKAQVRARNRAHYRAVQLLIHHHPDEFTALYLVEARREGVEPAASGKPESIHDLEVRIAELTARLERARSGGGD